MEAATETLIRSSPLPFSKTGGGRSRSAKNTSVLYVCLQNSANYKNNSQYTCNTCNTHKSNINQNRTLNATWITVQSPHFQKRIKDMTDFLKDKGYSYIIINY